MWLEDWLFQPQPPSVGGEGPEVESITHGHDVINPADVHNEAINKVPELWGVGSLHTGEHGRCQEGSVPEKVWKPGTPSHTPAPASLPSGCSGVTSFQGTPISW